MTKGNVTPIAGEEDRYIVESFGSSHNSKDEYLVDLSAKDFGCSCEHWDYKLRPTWEGLTAFKVGFKPLPELGCKHIKQAWTYRDNWQNVEQKQAELEGQIVVFPYGELFAAGKVVSAKLLTGQIEPHYELEVQGRSGKTIKMKTNEFSACFYDSYDEADAHIKTANN